MFEKIKTWVKNEAWSFCKRNIVWIVIGFIALWVLNFELAIIRNVLIVAIYEALALALSGIALFVYTKIKFVKELSMGKDGIMSNTEQYAFQNVIGKIFLGVHLLVAIVSLSLYLSYDKVQGMEAEKEAKTILVDTFAVKKAIIEDKIKTEIEIKVIDSLNKDTLK